MGFDYGPGFDYSGFRVPAAGAGYGAGAYGTGYDAPAGSGGSFVLIAVLFILLIIVGAARLLKLWT
jgi:uncharacterized protein (TIGR01732 family)